MFISIDRIHISKSPFIIYFKTFQHNPYLSTLNLGLHLVVKGLLIPECKSFMLIIIFYLLHFFKFIFIFQDIEDIDFLAATDHLAVRWTKFYHPHSNLSYYVCVGTAAGICDVDGKRKITGNTNFYLVSGLSLSTFQVCKM